MIRYPSYPYNFGALEEPEDPKALMLPIPYGYTASFGLSVREGPAAIIEASRNIEVIDDELLIPIESLHIKTLPFMESSAVGPEDMICRIEKVVEQLYNPKRLLVPIGGEHTITIGVVRALKKKHPTLSVLILDAHDDLREEYESSPCSHACVSRRISEICPVSIIGVRSISTMPEERPDNVQILFANQISKTEKWIELVKNLTEPVYISCDLDVFDPSIIPSVGSPEPAGLNWDDVTKILKFTLHHKKVVCTDFVELAPIPGFTAPNFTVAKLVARTIGYWIS